MNTKMTISNRWRNWARVEPFWAYSALICMMVGLAGLGVHLWILEGLWRTVALWVMIVGGFSCEVILVYRRQWWWAAYWGVCVLLGVIIFEIASCIYG